MASPPRPVHGQVILITGAARGIGAESARRLAARGARVSLVGLEPEELRSVAQDCGPESAWFEADVTSHEELERAVAGTVERFGGIDVAIANAGIATGGTVRAMDAHAWERVIDVNLVGVYRTVRACLPHVLERRGYLLPVASVAAMSHGPLMSSYAAAKAGVEAFANSLRLEVHHHGVDVGVAYFSWIHTDMVHGADEHPSFRLLRSKLRAPFDKTYPLADAADAVVHGVERRSRHVMAPGWIRYLIPIRGFIPQIVQRDMFRLAPQLEAEVEREVAAVGEDAFIAVGAGGAADHRSDVEHHGEQAGTAA